MRQGISPQDWQTESKSDWQTESWECQAAALAGPWGTAGLDGQPCLGTQQSLGPGFVPAGTALGEEQLS